MKKLTALAGSGQTQSKSRSITHFSELLPVSVVPIGNKKYRLSVGEICMRLSGLAAYLPVGLTPVWLSMVLLQVLTTSNVTAQSLNNLHPNGWKFRRWVALNPITGFPPIWVKNWAWWSGPSKGELSANILSSVKTHCAASLRWRSPSFVTSGRRVLTPPITSSRCVRLWSLPVQK